MKQFKVIILKDAITDLNEALAYYNNIHPSIAIKFSSSINSAFKDLKKNPFYQIRYDEFRMKVVKHFPYIIHYIVDENTFTISVYGIRNSYQNPGKYPKG